MPVGAVFVCLLWRVYSGGVCSPEGDGRRAGGVVRAGVLLPPGAAGVLWCFVALSLLVFSLPPFVRRLSAALLVGGMSGCGLFGVPRCGSGLALGLGEAHVLGWFWWRGGVLWLWWWFAVLGGLWRLLGLCWRRLLPEGGVSRRPSGGGLGLGLVVLGLANGAGCRGCLDLHCHQPSSWLEL